MLKWQCKRQASQQGGKKVVTDVYIVCRETWLNLCWTRQTLERDRLATDDADSLAFQSLNGYTSWSRQKPALKMKMKFLWQTRLNKNAKMFVKQFNEVLKAEIKRFPLLIDFNWKWNVNRHAMCVHVIKFLSNSCDFDIWLPLKRVGEKKRQNIVLIDKQAECRPSRNACLYFVLSCRGNICHYSSTHMLILLIVQENPKSTFLSFSPDSLIFLSFLSLFFFFLQNTNVIL